MNNEYSLTKSNESDFGYIKYRISAETDDLDFLKFLDSNIDILLENYASEKRNQSC